MSSDKFLNEIHELLGNILLTKVPYPLDFYNATIRKKSFEIRDCVVLSNAVILIARNQDGGLRF